MLTALAIVALGVFTLALARGLGLLRLSGGVRPAGLYVLMEFALTWPSLIVVSLENESTLLGFLGALALPVLLAGYGIAHGLRRRRSPRPSSTGARISTRERIQLAFLFGVATVTALLLYRGIPPIWSVLTELGISDEARARLSEERKLLTKGAYFGNSAYRAQGLLSVVQMCTWVLIAASFGAARPHTFRRSTVVLVFVVGSLLVGGVGERASVMLVVLSYMLARLASSGLRLHTAVLHYAPIVLVLLFFVGGFSGQIIGAKSSTDYLARIANRVFMGNGVNTTGIIELRNMGELPAGGGGIIVEQARAALPGIAEGEVPFSRRLAVIQGASSTTTYSTPTNLGLMYADWGWGGVYCLYFIFGIAFEFVERRITLARRSEHGLSDAVTSTIVLWCGYMALAGPVGAVVGFGITLVLFAASRLVSEVLSHGQHFPPRVPPVHAPQDSCLAPAAAGTNSRSVKDEP